MTRLQVPLKSDYRGYFRHTCTVRILGCKQLIITVLVLSRALTTRTCQFANNLTSADLPFIRPLYADIMLTAPAQCFECHSLCNQCTFTRAFNSLIYALGNGHQLQQRCHGGRQEECR
jgi:hypothetical protein